MYFLWYLMVFPFVSGCVTEVCRSCELLHEKRVLFLQEALLALVLVLEGFIFYRVSLLGEAIMPPDDMRVFGLSMILVSVLGMITVLFFDLAFTCCKCHRGSFWLFFMAACFVSANLFALIGS